MKVIQVLAIKDLVFDSNLYPRIKTNWLTVYQYGMAMRSGALFPPITVGTLHDKKYVVDGWHRVEALKLIGEEYVQAVVKNYKNERELFADAVKLNANHGRQLSVQEKARIIDRLLDYNFSLQEISEIVHVPVDHIQRFTLKVVNLPNGSKLYMKSIVENAVKDDLTLAQKIKQDIFNVRNVLLLLAQLKELLESGAFPLDNDNIKALAVEVYTLLGEILQVKTAEA